MPKKSDNFKSKSTRKPLRDVSNGRLESSSNSLKKKSPDSGEHQALAAGDALDRLLLVHSDLSVVVRQIDELVVEALKLKVVSKHERSEIESFANALSQIQTSLKPWVPRFQKALSSHSTGAGNQLDVCLASETNQSRYEDSSKEPESPDQTNLDSLVSPSPLVSWRADCTTEGGKQLFLLTPLPRPKAFSSKLQQSSNLVAESNAVDAIIRPPSHFVSSGDTNINLLDGVDLKPTSNKVSDPLTTTTKSAHEVGFVSPGKFTKRSCSMVVMTPCLTLMSPPKSCILLEPISEYSREHNPDTGKATQSQDSESSRQASEHLALKYPELFGNKAAHKLGNGRKAVEESPNWFMSPPKTCILLEPPEDKSLAVAVIKDIRTDSTLVKDNDNPPNGALIEQTPLWKEPDTTIQRGKSAGENTLKKELWTRFEAATAHGIRFNASVVKEIAPIGKDKGFLDLLEEVSFDDRKSDGSVR